jgi:hypothetical protein
LCCQLEFRPAFLQLQADFHGRRRIWIGQIHQAFLGALSVFEEPKKHKPTSKKSPRL